MRVGENSETVESVRFIPLLIIAFVLVLGAPVLAKPVPSATAPPKPTLIRLRADRIEFYYDRDLIEANGHVRVQASDGMTISGDTFSMDLRLNRFLIASHVHLRSRGGNIDGAAVSDFLDFDRVYFVPVISKPDRWTYVNGDFRTPLKGREMPGDVFYFPNLGATHPSLIASSAVIQTKSFARFSGVTANFLDVGVPLGTYYVYFGTGRDLEQNSLTGANFDATWNVTGNANMISALHFRYDQDNHAYAGFEQHFAGTDPHEYAVFSVSPFTTDDRYWNLVTGEHIGSKFQIDGFTQVYTNQFSTAQTTYMTLTQAFAHSYVTTFLNATNYNLSGNFNSARDGEPNHPVMGTLTWTSFNNRILKTPFYEQTYFTQGFNHDAYGLQNYGGVEYTTIWESIAGFNLSLPNVKIGDRNKAYALYYLNATMSSQRQWNSLPHRINTQNSTVSLSRQYSRFVNSYVAYNETNTSDLYLQGGYVSSPAILPNGQPYYPYAAFRGAESLRTATFATTYSATPNLVATVTLAHHQDFPGAYPELFTAPPTNAIGQSTYSNYMGQPPWQLTGEVRARILPHLMVDVQRTYYFHFGSQIWSPSFVVQFSQ